MGIEIIIFFYGIICISMILFNGIYAVLLKGSGSRTERRKRRFREDAEIQLKRIHRGEKIEAEYLSRLARRIRRVKNLLAFDQMLQELSAEYEEEGNDAPVRDYIIQLQPCVVQMADIYKNRDTIQAAYFSYFLSHHMIPEYLSTAALQEIMLEYMTKENLYCRVNAFQALCTFGDPEQILSALKIQDRGYVFLHEKILTEILLTFQGDYRRLIGLIWENLRKFTPRTQLALLNYIRFRSGEYCGEMLELLKAKDSDKEVLLSAIRYFGRYRYLPAYDLLLKIAGKDDPVLWEYVTVSVSALAAYRDPKTTEVLKKALHSSSWYVRSAAAASLKAQDVSDEDLEDIITGDDRYAREMMEYQLESGKLKKAGDAG